MSHDDVQPYEVYRPENPSVPLLRVNMVASADGRATDRAGRSGGLGGPGDREVFRSLRALADGILVGAGTARTEAYGPHRVALHLAPRRRADGRTRPAAIVVVSRSLQLDAASRLFTEAETPTVVLTCAAAPGSAREALRAVAEVVVAGEDEVDLPLGLQRLRDELGIRHVLCEGGPLLNGALLACGLVDELCLTVSPVLVGGAGLAIVRGEASDAAQSLSGSVVGASLRLETVCEQDGELYLRYTLLRT